MYRKPLTIRVSVVKKGLKKVTAATIAESLSSSPYEVGSDFKFPFCIIGKAHHCNLKFLKQSAQVSDTQCLLTLQEDKVWLVPVSPSFPTKLNQTLVTCPTLVKHGDLIGVGERLLYVDVSGGAYALETAGGSCDSETSQQISHVDTRSKVPVYRHALQPDMAGPRTPIVENRQKPSQSTNLDRRTSRRSTHSKLTRRASSVAFNSVLPPAEASPLNASNEEEENLSSSDDEAVAQALEGVLTTHVTESDKRNKSPHQQTIGKRARHSPNTPAEANARKRKASDNSQSNSRRRTSMNHQNTDENSRSTSSKRRALPALASTSQRFEKMWAPTGKRRSRVTNYAK